MKPHYKIPIKECGDPLAPIPLEQFSVVSPHPYTALGAPYGDRNPYFLRQAVLDRLLKAQQYLQEAQPGWQIQIFDAYRPLAVQQFMVDHTYAQLLREYNLDNQAISTAQREELMAQVYQFWAPPSPDPATPPPHSTGAAIDITLVDAQQRPIPMGADIDELSERSYPNHYVGSTDTMGQRYHQNRIYLASAMQRAGFGQHPNEWWHFSYGDQLWAWLLRKSHPQAARYGAMEDE